MMVKMGMTSCLDIRSMIVGSGSLSGRNFLQVDNTSTTMMEISGTCTKLKVLGCDYKMEDSSADETIQTVSSQVIVTPLVSYQSIQCAKASGGSVAGGCMPGLNSARSIHSTSAHVIAPVVRAIEDPEVSPSASTTHLISPEAPSQILPSK